MNRLISLPSIVAVILFLTISPVFGAKPTAADYIAYHMPLLGSWKVTVVEGETTYHGTVQWQLTLGGKSFLVNSHVEGLFYAHTLFGYDPDSEKFVGTSLAARGRCQFNTLEISDTEIYRRRK